MNKIIIIGNLTKDPEFAETRSGVALCRFTVAVNRPYEDANGNRAVDFFDITAWRSLAENCSKYLFKGYKCAVTGAMQSEDYEDREGIQRRAWKVVAENVEFLTPKSSGVVAPSEGVKTRSKAVKQISIADLTEVDDADLPF